MAKEIGSKREKKLSIPVQEVEIIIGNLLVDYNLDETIESFINNKLDNILNETEIKRNNELKNSRGYNYQFGIELFDDIYEFVYPLLKESIEDSLESIRQTDTNYEESEDYKKKVLIYNNVFQIIELTMYNEGISKIKLISYHYLVKCLEQRAHVILEDKEVKLIRGYKTVVEVFSYEILSIIAADKELEKFTLTLRSLIEQWLIKYNNRTKIGQFYYDVLMVNPEQIIEKILRYLLFTAIKNVNPITLRAIFSTYITLIHKNIFSFYAMKLQDVKVGYFKQLEALFEDSIINNTHFTDINQMIIQNRLMIFGFKNKRFLKHNYEFLLDEYSSSFFDINYYDFLYSYRKDMNVLDYHFYYSKILKITNNSIRSQSKLFKINNNYFKKNSKKTLKLYLNDLVNDNFYTYFYEMFKEPDTARTICDNITDNLLANINQNNFSTADFKQIQLSTDDYISQLSQLLFSMNKLIED